MNCIAPPELSDGQLWAYVDGEAPPDVLAHLARCQHCTARAMRLAGVSGRLKQHLYRLLCPTSIELGEYHLGVLDRVRVEEIARHIEDCPLCRAEIVRLSGYLGQLAPEIEGARLMPARVLIARIVAGAGAARQPGFAPAFAGLRGDDEPAIYEAEDIRVALDVQPELERPDRRTLLGLVTAAEMYHLSAQLQQTGQTIATVQVDAIGNFVIADLVPDTYDLILSDPHVEIRIPELRV
jgi:hypothetical protein